MNPATRPRSDRQNRPNSLAVRPARSGAIGQTDGAFAGQRRRLRAGAHSAAPSNRRARPNATTEPEPAPVNGNIPRPPRAAVSPLVRTSSVVVDDVGAPTIVVGVATTVVAGIDGCTVVGDSDSTVVVVLPGATVVVVVAGAAVVDVVVGAIVVDVVVGASVVVVVVVVAANVEPQPLTLLSQSLTVSSPR